MPDLRPRKKITMAARRLKVSDMYLSGSLQVDIAKELGVAQPTVSRDLKVLRQAWLASSLVNIDTVKAQELAKIDRLEIEYWEAWKRSCEDSETVKKRGKPDSSGITTASIEQTSKEQVGDSRFLAGVQWCIERRCKLFGLDKPQEVSMSDLTIVYKGNINPSVEL